VYSLEIASKLLERVKMDKEQFAWAILVKGVLQSMLAAVNLRNFTAKV
jgi:hypothetical protein